MEQALLLKLLDIGGIGIALLIVYRMHMQGMLSFRQEATEQRKNDQQRHENLLLFFQREFTAQREHDHNETTRLIEARHSDQQLVLQAIDQLAKRSSDYPFRK